MPELEVNKDLATLTYSFVIPEGWVVVKAEADVFREHWDSDRPDTAALLITLWSSEHVSTFTTKQSIDVRWGYDVNWANGVEYLCVVPVINATEEQVAEWEAFKAAQRYVLKILNIADRAFTLKHGAIVNVTRGRKTPKGAYEVTKVGESRYGLYVNLRDGDGKTFALVSRSNIEVRPDYEAAFGPDLRDRAGFIARLIDTEFQEKTVWLVFADYIEEFDVIPAASLLRNSEPTFTATQFSVALRRIINGGTIHKLPLSPGFRFELRDGLPI